MPDKLGKAGVVVLDSPGSRRHLLHPVGHLLNLEGVAEGEDREDGRPEGKVEATGRGHTHDTQAR